MSLLDKVKDFTDNEVIGELDKDKSESKKKGKGQKPKKVKMNEKKNKSKKKPVKNKKKEKKDKSSGFLSNLFKKKDEDVLNESDLYQEQSNPIFDNIESEEDDIDPSKYIKTDVAGGRSRTMIMNEFGVSVGAIMPPDLPTAEDVDSVRFAVTVPSGFDTGEVDEFVDMMVVTVSGYRKELIKQSDINQKLVDEILRLDRQALDQRNQETLDSFIAQGSNEKERLQNQLVDAQLKNNDLERKIEALTKGEVLSSDGSSSTNSDLIEENKILKNKIDILQSKLSSLQSKSSEETSDGIEEKLEDALRRNEELSQEVQRLKAAAANIEVDEVRDDTELLLEIERLREENERLLSSKDDEVVERLENNSVEIKIERESIESDDNSNAFKELFEAMDEGGDAEEEAIKKIEAQASSQSKRARRTLSEDDIEKIKEAQENKNDILSNVSTGDEMMDNLLKEMNS